MNLQTETPNSSTRAAQAGSALHTSLLMLFDGIERELRDVDTSAEVAAFAQVAEDLTHDYARANGNRLLLPPVNLPVADSRAAHADRHLPEWVCLLKLAKQANHASEAKGHLLQAMRTLRGHFGEETRKP